MKNLRKADCCETCKYFRSVFNDYFYCGFYGEKPPKFNPDDEEASRRALQRFLKLYRIELDYICDFYES